MGPILPQLSVFGKQIGIAPEVMGYITCILPVMYVIAKPMFGFVADYFAVGLIYNTHICMLFICFYIYFRIFVNLYSSL